MTTLTLEQWLRNVRLIELSLEPNTIQEVITKSEWIGSEKDTKKGNNDHQYHKLRFNEENSSILVTIRETPFEKLLYDLALE